MTVWESVIDDKPVRLFDNGGSVVAEEASGRDQMARPVGWHPIEGTLPKVIQEALDAITSSA